MPRPTFRMTAVAATIAAVALVSTGAAAQQKKAGGCVLAGGEATMVTGDLARFMANAALNNSISGKGLKPSGQVKLVCKDGIASVHCLAQQRACR